MKENLHIVIRKEWKYFVARVLENDVSSFGKTFEEAFANIKEAVDLYYEDISEDYSSYNIQSPSLITYTHKYAQSIQS